MPKKSIQKSEFKQYYRKEEFEGRSGSSWGLGAMQAKCWAQQIGPAELAALWTDFRDSSWSK